MTREEIILDALDRYGARELLTRVVAAHGIPEADVLGTKRKAEIVSARHDLWGRVDRATTLTAGGIAKIFGVDRTTVLSALEKLAAKQNVSTKAFQVELPVRTRNSLNMRGHTRWAAIRESKERKEQRAIARVAVGAYVTKAGGPSALLPCVVTLTRIAPSSGLDPFDGLPASLKACVDGVADALGLKNDRSELVEWVARQRRGKPRAYAVVVNVTPRSELAR